MRISDGSADVCSSDLWFSLSVPERRIGGWFYNQVLATQRVCNGGAWVWDDSPAAALYEQNHKGLEIPDVAALDLRDVPLPNGNHIEVLEPLISSKPRYRQPGRLDSALRFAGTMAPTSQHGGKWGWGRVGQT